MMKKQCIVVGLGWFGMNIAKCLSDEGFEVLAIDKEISLVEKAGKFTTKAVCLAIRMHLKVCLYRNLMLVLLPWLKILQ